MAGSAVSKKEKRDFDWFYRLNQLSESNEKILFAGVAVLVGKIMKL